MERDTNMNEHIKAVLDNVEKIIIGKREPAILLLTAMLAKGHVLLEDVPGVGKTQLAASIAHTCDAKFNRLQLTPDVMPSDITGFTMIHPGSGEMEFRPGAVFCNFLLADEINRSSPKTQSALLETMEEGQLSIDGNTYQLPCPFMVLATQNPVETYGTYHLPEAQMDRFLFKVSMGYPTTEEEISILQRDAKAVPSSLQPVIHCDEISSMQEQVLTVKCHPRIMEYIVHLIRATRESEYLRLGASPRATLALYRAGLAYACINGRDYVLPDDIKYLAPFVLTHRVMLSPKGKSVLETAENVIAEILRTIAVPSI